MTTWDKVLIAMILAAFAASFLLVRAVIGVADGPLVAVVKVDGVVQERLVLSKDVNLVVTSPAGSCRLTIEDGAARIVSADCPNNLCITQGPIDRAGELIVCLPHRVVVSVEGSLTDKIDAVVQ